MAINNELAAQVRRLLIQHLPDGVAVDDISEKKMFGGLAFMVQGKMCVAISGRDGCEVMLRIGQARHEAALQHEGVRTTVMRGRAYRGYIDLDETALPMLGHWIALALQYNQTLPANVPENSVPQGSAPKNKGRPNGPPPDQKQTMKRKATGR